MIRLVILLSIALAGVQRTDESIFSHIVETSRQQLWQELPTGDIIVDVGKHFIGSQYAPFTLEEQGAEHLVVNLREFDCVTFVENVLAITRGIQSRKPSFESYKNNLQRIRYRGGVLNGYPSRLHYFSEWIDDNSTKSFVRDMAGELGGVQQAKVIDWMTTHKEAYRQLQDSAVFAQMADQERKLSNTTHRYIPSDIIHQIESKLRNGDIIAMVSSKSSLDVAHAGIAIRMDDGSIHYMHAPDVKGSVKISEEPLHEYVKKHKPFLGIMVARPIE